MKAIEQEETKRASAWQLWPRWATVVCAAAALIIAVPLLRTGGKTDAASLLAQSAQATGSVRSVHIIGRMRTVPGDNFEMIGTGYDFVPVEIWRAYSNPPRWRVEKPGRVVVMDGTKSLLYISKTNTAAVGTPGTGFIEWLRPLLDPSTILEKEAAGAVVGGGVSNGVRVVLARRPAAGDFRNDWLRNKTIVESDHTTTYRIDPASKLLEGLSVSIADTTVAEFDQFRYNESFPPELFALNLPANVIWLTDNNGKVPTLALNGPRDAAVYFFDALAREDWDAALGVYPETRVSEVIRKTYGGLQVISIGEPFQSGTYAGWFVPYQVRLRTGYLKNFKLAVRNDNPARRWLVDGGF